jgi:hypothetical protein
VRTLPACTFGDLQLLCDRRHIDFLALEGARRRARGNAQALYLGEDVEQLFREPIGEVLASSSRLILTKGSTAIDGVVSCAAAVRRAGKTDRRLRMEQLIDGPAAVAGP